MRVRVKGEVKVKGEGEGEGEGEGGGAGEGRGEGGGGESGSVAWCKGEGAQEAHLFVEFDDLGGEWLGQLLENVRRLLARGEAGGGLDQGLWLGVGEVGLV